MRASANNREEVNVTTVHKLSTAILTGSLLGALIWPLVDLYTSMH